MRGNAHRNGIYASFPQLNSYDIRINVGINEYEYAILLLIYVLLSAT